ncbi:hypothetical protein EVAR_44326_1 [Eumeta japonica]|uniref:Uncharacterized protein n=1 Tax=Eumeta variegata TaxID=151549 RepID=A0A4C1XBH0_EUMVA|nr:hypothetical protein EVAR_44326_1 [Eumeta japonica]
MTYLRDIATKVLIARLADESYTGKCVQPTILRKRNEREGRNSGGARVLARRPSAVFGDRGQSARVVGRTANPTIRLHSCRSKGTKANSRKGYVHMGYLKGWIPDYTEGW